MADPLTADELRAIGERLKQGVLPKQRKDDCARLFAAMERLIKAHLLRDGGNCWLFAPRRGEELHLSVDAAIDALLSGGSQ